MKIKFGIKQIVLLCVAVVLVGVLIAGNIVLNMFSPLLHQVFAGNTTNYDTEDAQNALAAGDDLVQEMAEGSMVLLENKNNTLPLDTTDKINLFGWNATDQGFMLTGGGSGGTVIADQNKITLTQALKKEGLEYNETLLKAYSDVSSADADANASAQATTLNNPTTSFYTDKLMESAYDYSDIAVIVLSRFARENGGAGELVNVGSYSNGAILELTANERAMFNAVNRTFGGDKGRIIVLINTCNNMELAFIDEFDVDAAIYVGVPGQSGALAIPRLLRGQTTEKDEDGNDVVRYVTPSGRTADIYPYSYNPENNKNYSSTWINAISSDSSVVYSEGVYYGYKWYETADAEGYFDEVIRGDEVGYEAVVQYPFGYGLSYTEFSWELLTEPQNKTLTVDGKYELTVRVSNIGEVPGEEVVQLYYTPPYIEGGIEKAEVNLLAFGKTTILEPGKFQDIKLSFSAYDLASFDDYDKNRNNFAGYELDAGNYGITLRKNSHELATLVDGSGKATSKTGFNMTCAGVKFENDPVTGEKVTTRMTGSNAYGKIPVDGTTVNNQITYLSRAGHFANFGSIKKYSANQTNNTQYSAYDKADTSKIKYGVNSGLYLVVDENGNKLSYKALAGEESGVRMEYNIDLMLELADYESEVWGDFLNQLTEQETKNLIGMGGFQTAAIESVGKPRCVDRDGPAGFNMGVTNTNTDSRWTAFPVEALIGCSWSQRLAYSMGRSQGAIANATGLRGWYGPGVNLHRSPYNSRNFEYYSEDALLSGKLAAEVVRGAKQSNTYCYIKHFAASEAGQNPGNWYTWLTEQNLRENYLRPFEIAVKEGGSNAIMSAFNRIGSEWVGRHGAVSTEILRGEWGFRGSMITDWASNYMDHTAGVLGGNDLWLCGSTQTAASLDLSDNAVKYAARQSVKNILYTYIDTYVTAYDFAENGDENDPYKVSVGKIEVTAAPYSPVFVALWVLVDILLVGGIAVCAVFFVISPSKKNQAAAE